MVKEIFKKIHIISISIFFIFIFLSLFSKSTASVQVQLQVEGCNNNNICEIETENNSNCSNDCTTCNHNNVCEILKGETPALCPSDCQTELPPVTPPATPSVTTSYRSSARMIQAPVPAPVPIPIVVNGDILNLNIIPGINYGIISWDTEVPTDGQISWGAGDNFNDGSIKNDKIDIHHQAIIENLSPDTKYYYFIKSTLPEYYLATETGMFTTLPIPEINTVPTISNLLEKQTESDIVLNWQNPDSKDFMGVKVVRSPFFFPADPSDGKIIYDGNGTYARDSNVSLDTKYYYSSFSYNKNLDFSSGVLAEGYLKSKNSTTSELNAPDMSPVNISFTHSNLKPLPLSNITFAEGDMELPMSSSSAVKVYPFSDIRIIIDTNRVSFGTKILILRIYDPEDSQKVYSYSFSIDPTNRFYYITVPNTLTAKVYPFSIISYGADHKEISIAKSFFDIRAVEVPKSNIKPWIISSSIIFLIFIFFLIFF